MIYPLAGFFKGTTFKVTLGVHKKTVNRPS